MDAQAVSNILGAAIQVNVVILTVTGTFLTFVIAFTWQHTAKAETLLLQKERLEQKTHVQLQKTLGAYRNEVKKVYQYWFRRNPKNLARFFDHIAFGHPVIDRCRFFRQAALLYSAVFARRFIKLTQTRTDPAKNPFRLFRPEVRLITWMALVFADSFRARGLFRPTYHLNMHRRGIHPPFLSWYLFTLAVVRAIPQIGRLQGEANRVLLENGQSQIAEQDLLEWAALHELTAFFPRQVVFPIDLTIPPTVKKRYTHFSVYGNEDRLAFDSAKHTYLPKGSLKNVASLQSKYASHKEALEGHVERIHRLSDEVLKLSFFVQPEKRKRIKRAIALLVTFSAIDTFWSFLVMRNWIGGASDSVSMLGVNVSLFLTFLVLALLAILIGTLLRSL